MKTNDPAGPAAAPEEALSAAFQLLNRLDANAPRKPPSLLTVFRLYCMEEMNVVDVARQCRCSIGTVSHRLKLLRLQIGCHPRHFRKRNF